MHESRDQDLVERCKRGDRRALEALVREYEKPIFNAAYRMLGNAEDAADIAQTAFLKAFENLDRYDPKHKFFSWIYRIAINESINLYQRGKRQEPIGDQEFESASRGPEDATAASMLADQVQSQLMELQDDYRAVLVLRHFSDCSYQEMSEILHVPEKTVKSRLYTARQLLKDKLKSSRII